MERSYTTNDAVAAPAPREISAGHEGHSAILSAVGLEGLGDD